VLRLGVTTLQGLRRARNAARPRHVSFLLLRSLAGDPAATREDYDAVIRYAPMPNGTWKFTQQGRMAAVDARLLEILRAEPARGSPLTVCDLAASTGVTSLELHAALRREFAVEFIASDYYRDLVAVRRRHRPWAVIFDARGHAVQYVVGPVVLSCGRPDSIVHAGNRVLARIMRARIEPVAREALGRVSPDDLTAFAGVQVGPYEIVRMPMLAGEVLRALGAPEFRFETWDVLQPLPVRAHVVRAMNIFTRDHFRDDDRRRGLEHCVQAVHPGGLFVVGWSPYSQPSAVQASIYRVHDRQLTRLDAFDGGSEIDALLASMFAVTDRAAARPGVAYAPGSETAA
jgi:hypothetical protein